MKPIKKFWQEHTIFPDRVFLMLAAFGIIASATLMTVNQLYFHFTFTPLFATNIPLISLTSGFFSLAFSTFCLIYGITIQNEYPRSSTFIWGMGLFFWTIFINLVWASALQTTPFPPIDDTLVKIDQWMRISTTDLMAWTHTHPHIHHMLNFIYASIILELIFIPITLAIFNARKALGIFFIAQLFSFFIGGAIYYFFPTMAPSGVLHSPYFSLAEHDTSMRFYQVHHFLKVTSAKGGLIAFPSFHVVWVILLTYACVNKKIIFWPLLCYNLILIASTVFLGWHYATDVIGGFILGIGAIVFAEWVYRAR
ncbi:MAG: phosphatase PAP2 family protein [Gammaproteobacteria bacterium]|nr:phosphatase PAP2 family protein [Gammaproteobacteria bacterium]